MNIVKSNFGNPYWWDTCGQIADENLYREKKKIWSEYYRDTDFVTQYGKRVFDCSGLIKGYLWAGEQEIDSIYKAIQDINSKELMNACDVLEDIKIIPEIPGILVFFEGHVGVYIGEGKVIEARGHSFGVVETNLKDRPWKKWGKLKWIVYE